MSQRTLELAGLAGQSSLDLTDLRLDLIHLLARKGLPAQLVADLLTVKGYVDSVLALRAEGADLQRKANRSAEVFAADKERNGDDSWRIDD